jgi:two-component system NarL family sensor kinase
MWVSPKHSPCRLTRSQLETLLLQRTTALQSLAQRLLKVQDEERRRVARDLHDTTGQTLAALKMAVASLEYQLQQHHDTAGVLCDINALADQALKEIRTTSYLLHPPLLDEIGFSPAAQWYVQGFGERSGIKTTLDFVTGLKRLPAAIETALFRVLQESLTNVHRHSGASEVKVKLYYQPEAVVLEIADSGRGIPPELMQSISQGNAETGVGLAGMRERMSELNGFLEINSNDFGTTLRAVVPLAATSPLSAVDLSQRCRAYSIVPSSVAANQAAMGASL